MDNFINKLYCMDNLELLKQLPDNSIDIIYSDILYATGRNFDDYQDLPYNRKEVDNFYIPRIKEMHRILKSNGTMVLQMDYRIDHWLRCIADEYFGYKNCVNVIQWCYSSGGASKKKLSTSFLLYGKCNSMVLF